MDTTRLKGQIPDNVYNEIQSVVYKFHINTPLRLTHFLSQCAHESGGFKHNIENLNYSTKGLLTIFPKYFKEVALAEAYHRKPEKIASRVYGNRMGNGDEFTGDGWRYRGRGYIQLTGKSNYIQFDSFVEEDIIKNPDLVATKYPLLSAAWFFNKNGINLVSDNGSEPDVVKSVTKKVNGGFNGLQDRQKYFDKYYTLLR
jgi:putative chitinase